MLINWDNIAINLTSVAVILFVIGFLAARFGSPVKLPESVYDAITIFLLLGIGLKGGVALRANFSADLIIPLVVTLLLGVVIPFLAFGALRWVRKLSPVDRAAISAHYGSTSLVTFTAALFYLDSIRESYEGYVSTLLVALEIPGIVVGILLGARSLSSGASAGSIRESIKEVLWGKTVFLLVAGLVAGAITGSGGYARVEPFFSALLPGVLALFLMHLGHVAGSRLDELRRAGLGLTLFALAFPVVAGMLGVLAGSLIGLSVGGTTALATLLASASYIAAPAAVGIALPAANLSLAVTPSLAVTFPFNLSIGIPLYFATASALATVV